MTKEEFNNLGVGEIFQLGYRKFKVIENEKKLCGKCCFKNNKLEGFCLEMMEELFLPECCSEYRKDKKNVIFMEVQNESLE